MKTPSNISTEPLLWIANDKLNVADAAILYKDYESVKTHMDAGIAFYLIQGRESENQQAAKQHRFC